MLVTALILIRAMTIVEEKPNLQDLKVAIVGDVLHSRVANSFQSLAALLGVKELVFVAPDEWHPASVQFGRITNSLKDGIANADVVIGLRVQRERLEDTKKLDLETYHDNYALTADSVKFAKDDVMIMHPGPINRGVEIDSDVADAPNSFILRQVENGVYMRMAIIEALIK